VWYCAPSVSVRRCNLVSSRFEHHATRGGCTSVLLNTNMADVCISEVGRKLASLNADYWNVAP
jgi:hypothetical protein